MNMIQMSLCHCVNLYPWPTSLSKGSYALQLLVAGLCWQDQHRWVGAAQLIAVLVHQIWFQPSLSKKCGSDGIIPNQMAISLRKMGFQRQIWEHTFKWNQLSSELVATYLDATPCGPESVDRTSDLKGWSAAARPGRPGSNSADLLWWSKYIIDAIMSLYVTMSMNDSCPFQS
jgi:hypothetical protein